jgi:transposase, IS5 family
VVGQAKKIAQELADEHAADPLKQLALDGLREQIETMVPRVKQVMKQIRARIFRGDTRSEGGLFGIFEPSTEIIRKGKAGKPNEFGKVVRIQKSENQIVVDYEVYDQRPSDSEVLIPAIEAHQRVLGRTPHLVAGDAAFYSQGK